jgi:hypothetical protein
LFVCLFVCFLAFFLFCVKRIPMEIQLQTSKGHCSFLAPPLIAISN